MEKGNIFKDIDYDAIKDYFDKEYERELLVRS